MIRECTEAEGGGYQFIVSYHFEANVKAAGDRSHPARVKRLAQEAVTLATSLPLSYSSSVSFIDLNLQIVADILLNFVRVIYK